MDSAIVETPEIRHGGLSYADVFDLQSKPDSNFTIFLDFDGHVTEDTSWNTNYGIASIESPPFDLDGDPTTFSQLELIASWFPGGALLRTLRPFDINVTTRDPGVAALSNSGVGDGAWGARAIVTNDTFAACGCGGFAFLNSFASNDTPTFVFNHGPGSLGETFSHEVGHMLGLSHDGDDGEYYRGHGEENNRLGSHHGRAIRQKHNPMERWRLFQFKQRRK